MSNAALADAHRTLREDLVRWATPLADQTRNLLDAAVARRDAEAVRREGYDWSGRIGLSILRLADQIEAAHRDDEK